MITVKDINDLMPAYNLRVVINQKVYPKDERQVIIRWKKEERRYMLPEKIIYSDLAFAFMIDVYIEMLFPLLHKICINEKEQGNINTLKNTTLRDDTGTKREIQRRPRVSPKIHNANYVSRLRVAS